MKIGTMNHPGHKVLKEIEWIGRMGMSFLDLTLEPPLADVRHVDAKAIRAALEEYHLDVIGHTAYYLPLCSPFESLRRAAVDELKLCLEVFAAVGARWMNLHPDRQAPMHDRKFVIERNLQTIGELMEASRGSGVGLMIENLPAGFNSVRQLRGLFDPLPELGFHLDIGHANLMVEHSTTDELLNAFGSRLRHVHLHDNKGGDDDLHMPLGAGTLDVERAIRSLRRTGYDGTITLEVFTPDRFYLDYSRKVLQRIWDQTTEQPAQAKAA
jgi:sugar phosphate isomerase/epimerase